MHRSVMAFWNACLIEEATENYVKKKDTESIGKLNLSNVITKDRYFFDNIDFILRNHAYETISLTDWMIKCPLLWAFTNAADLKAQAFHVVVKPGHELEIYPFENRLDMDYNVYKILKGVRVKDAPLEDFSAAKDKIAKTISALSRIEYDILYILDEENTEEDIAKDLNEIQIFKNRVTTRMVKDFRKNYPRESNDGATNTEDNPVQSAKDTDKAASTGENGEMVQDPLFDDNESKDTPLKPAKKIVVSPKKKK